MQKILSPNIQVLRAVSVLAVVAFHLNSSFFRWGYLGVDAFFVVSGFVITPQLMALAISKAPMNSLKSFFAKRLRRLAPALGIVLVTTSLLMTLIGPLSELRFFTIQGMASLLFAANLAAFRLSRENYFNPNPNGLIHTWSLSTEEQIYFILPLALIFYYKIWQNFSKAFYLLLILTYLGYKLLLINPGDFASSTPLSNPNALFYSPISRIWEFLVGSVVFLFLQANSRKKRITANPILKILICTVLILICSKLGLPELISVSSAIFIIYSDDLFAKPSKLNKALTWIGDKSYVIYLVHMPIIHIFHNSPLFVKFSTPFLNIVSVIIILLTTIVISSKWENQYRASGKFENTRIKRIIIMFIIIPFIILSVLRVGSITFFGFTKPPVLQGTILCENPGNYGECVKFNNNATGDLILIGDSHAAAVSKSVEDIAVNANKNFILMQGRGCQILPLEENEISNDVVYKKPRSCKEIVSNIFQLVKSKPNAQILLSQRSIVIQKDVEDKYLNLKIQGIKQLQQFNSNITVVGSVPEFKESQHQGTAFDLFSKTVSIEKSTMLPEPFFEDLEMKREMKNLNIRYISTVDILCKKRCILKNQGAYLYWDENHISLEGAIFLSTDIKNSLKN
jgi:peptidoglycan/LPS O-acetylase OafA/YrhL